MKDILDFSLKNIESLTKFLEQNKGVNYITSDLNTEERIIELNFKNLANKKQKLLPLLRAYQRLLRIIPDERQDIALVLLKQGVHSALQIASMTRRDFMERYARLLGGDGKLAEKIYQNALKKRSKLLVQYMNLLQNNEPHISTARFN